MEYVLITGASTGIGLELAKIFAEHNYALILVSSNEVKLLNAKKEIEAQHNVPILTYTMDLGVLGNEKVLYEMIKREKIHISILVNNAGFGLVGATEKIDFNRDEQMMILNNISLVNLTKHVLPDMYAQGTGRILNVASTGAFQPGPYTSTYFASKSFVVSYSRAVRYEAKKKGVSVSVLCPGATKTNFFIQEGVKEPVHVMPATKVALYAYKGLMKNKTIMIPGMFNKLQRFIPSFFKMKIIAEMKNQ